MKLEYVKLEPGWLEKQIKKTQEEVAAWPPQFLEARRIQYEQDKMPAVQRDNRK